MVDFVRCLVRNIWGFGMEWGRGVSTSTAHSVSGGYGRQRGDYHRRANTGWADRLAKHGRDANRFGMGAWRLSGTRLERRLVTPRARALARAGRCGCLWGALCRAHGRRAGTVAI